MFITTAVAFRTLFIVTDAFFHMLMADLGAGVFMTAVTGISVIVVIDMAGYAFSTMVFVETEVLLVIECRRCPAFLHMAGATVAVDLSVQRIARGGMAAVALLYQIRFNQFMGELAYGAEGLYTFVLTVAGDTVILDQLLMEGHTLIFLIYAQTLGGLDADLIHLMALDTLARAAAEKGCMAGEAVAGDLGMGLNRVARADHGFGRGDGKPDQHDYGYCN